MESSGYSSGAPQGGSCAPLDEALRYIPCEGSPYHHIDIFDHIAKDMINHKVRYNMPVILLGASMS